MIYFLALIPATALVIGGYFVMFLSNRSEGAFRAFGKYLGFWAFTLAGLLVLGAIFAAAHGGGHCPMMRAHMGPGMMHGPGMMAHPGMMGGSWADGGRPMGPCACEPDRTSQPGETPPGSAPQRPAPSSP